MSLILREQYNSGDITKGSILLRSEVDSNFISLRNSDIIGVTANTATGKIILTKYGGDTIETNIPSLTGLTLLSDIYVGNTLFVSTNGNVLYSTREALDLRYKTISAALVDAQLGDTIMVCSGTYIIGDTITRSDVNYSTLGVVTIIYTGTTYLFNLSNIDTNFHISGNFILSSNTGNVINIDGVTADGSVNIDINKIMLYNTNKTGVTISNNLNGATINLNTSIVSSGVPLNVNNVTGTSLNVSGAISSVGNNYGMVLHVTDSNVFINSSISNLTNSNNLFIKYCYRTNINIYGYTTTISSQDSDANSVINMYNDVARLYINPDQLVSINPVGATYNIYSKLTTMELYAPSTVNAMGGSSWSATYYINNPKAIFNIENNVNTTNGYTLIVYSGTVNLNGNINGRDRHENLGIHVYGGELNINGVIYSEGNTITGGNYRNAYLNSNGGILNMYGTSAIVTVRGELHNIGATPYSHAINLWDGKLILDGAVLTTSHANALPIRCNTCKDYTIYSGYANRDFLNNIAQVTNMVISTGSTTATTVPGEPVTWGFVIGGNVTSGYGTSAFTYSALTWSINGSDIRDGLYDAYTATTFASTIIATKISTNIIQFSSSTNSSFFAYGRTFNGIDYGGGAHYTDINHTGTTTVGLLTTWGINPVVIQDFHCAPTNTLSADTSIIIDANVI